MKHTSVSFPCGELMLQGDCCYPDGDSPFPGVILCHPHPLYGGSMNNNVIQTLASTLVSRFIIAFIFNFRGVGGSEGSFGDGIDEQEDVIAAIDWLVSRSEIDADRVGLAGYSFGSIVAAPVACNDARIKALTLISPALQQSQINCIKQCDKPKFLISGSNDYFLPAQKAEMIYKEAAEPKKLKLVSGADHFWLGYEKDIAEMTADFFNTRLKSG